MIIKNCMKRQVFSVPVSASVVEAAQLMVEKHIGTLPVLNEAGKLVGLLQLRDLLTLVMPDFIRLVENFQYVHDFGAVETRFPDQDALDHPIKDVMNPPICVDEDCGLIRATAVMNRYQLSDLPVVNAENVLIGIASRVDIAVRLISDWELYSKGSSR